MKKLSRQAAPQHQGLCLGTMRRGSHPLLLDDSALRSHVALSGRNGTGRSILLRQMLVQQTVEGRGWVHLDLTGDQDLRDQLASAARDAGRLDEFYVLDLVEPAESNTYDVLRGGSAESRAQRVLTLFMHVHDAEAETHRQLSELLTLLFKAIDATGKSVGLHEVSELLMRLDTPAGREQFMSAVPEGHPAGVALATALDAIALAGPDGQRLKTVASAAAGRLALLASLKCSAVFSQAQSEIDFEDILVGGKMCYISLRQTGKDTVVFSMARMALQDICSAMWARSTLRGSERTPFLVAMDCFPCYGMSDPQTAPVSDSGWAQARALNVSLVPVVDSRNWDSVHAAYRTEGMTENTFTKIYFQQDASEQLATQHPNMPASALKGLQADEFLICQGSTVVEGKLRYTETGIPPGFTKQPMPVVDTRPRLDLPRLQLPS